jgi:hypothetical protein
MKKIMMAMAAAAMLLSCETENPTVTVQMKQSDEEMQKKEITFTFGDGISQQPMTRATLTELNLTDLWVFDYIGGELVTNCHQLSNEDGFGSLALSMEYGTHTLYFVASRGANPTVSTEDKTITWQTVRDTFWATLQMTVEPSTGGTEAVSLNRVVGKLKISVTDVIPDGAAKFVVTPSTWYYGLRYDTGEAVNSQSTPISVNIPSSYIGTTDLVMNVFTISGTTAWNTDVTATLLASDNSTLGSVTIQDVPIQRNHITNYKGGILSTGRQLTISSDDEWIEDNEVTW